MTEYVTGQNYGWNGGECPVHFKTRIVTWHRGGITQRTEAGKYWWEHRKIDGDIVCFQVITPYAEPKVIWVNEYEGGGVAFGSEEEAKKWTRGHTRVAVKYVEVKE